MHGCRWLVVVAALAALALAAPARAASYRVDSCKLPNGKPAPTHDATSGWQSEVRAGTQSMTLDDQCASGGGIHAHLGGNSPTYGWGGDWRFVPPANTSLGGFAITWSGTVTNGGEATLSRSDQRDPLYVERNGASFGLHTVTQSGFDIASLAAIAACSFPSTPGGPCGPDPVDFTIDRAVMTINDFSAPEASAASGPLLTAPVMKGRMGVRLTASDAGGGVYRVVVAADGRGRAAVVLPDASGRCRPVDARHAHDFAWPKPCQSTFQGTVSIDTRRVPDGRHSIAVYLEDAAGNRTTLASPKVRVVHNLVSRGALNGANGGDGARLARRGHRRVVTGFAHRRPLLRGWLTRGGTPVAGARLDVLQRVSVRGARLVRIGTTTTNAAGRYRIRVRAGPSRLLRIGYRSHANDPFYTAQVDVIQRVRAGVTLKLRDQHVGLRGVARFSGKVRGGFIPPAGKLVELQAFDGGRWRTFATVRTRRTGRFTARYRFTQVAAPRTFRFRARSRFESGFPYALGVSRVVRLRVG